METFKELESKFGLKKSSKYEEFGAYEATIDVVDAMEGVYPFTYLDKRFQRAGGVEHDSGWKFEGIRKYATSFVKGRTGNDIILIHVPSALKNERDKDNPCLKTIRYYTKLYKDGHIFLILEGNNSLSTLNAFYTGHESVFIEYKGEKKVYFKNLQELGIETVFTDRSISVLFLCNITREEISDTFIGVNSGVDPNPQEKRGATSSDFSDEIFKLAKANTELFKKLVNLKSFNTDAKDHHQLISKFYMKKETGYGTNTGTTLLNERYNTQTFDQGVSDKVATNLENLKKAASQYYAEKEADDCDFCPDKNKLSLKSSDFATLYLFFDLISSQYKIVDHSSLLSLFFDIDLSLVKVEDKMIVEEAKQSGVSKLKRFWWRAMGVSLVDLLNETVNKPNTIRGISYIDYMIEENIIKVIRGRSSNFDASLKTELFNLQEGQFRDGNKLSSIDLHLKNYLHIDHVKSHSQGGKTSIENAEIMKSFDNLSKGSKDSEPHFEHQKASGE